MVFTTLAKVFSISPEILKFRSKNPVTEIQQDMIPPNKFEPSGDTKHFFFKDFERGKRQSAVELRGGEESCCVGDKIPKFQIHKFP